MSSATPQPCGSWKHELQTAVTKPHALAFPMAGGPQDVDSVVRRYPMRVTPYFLSLIQQWEDPLGKQVLPNLQELTDTLPHDDPLHENRQSPVPGLIHRYPDRVLFLVSSECAVYCRYCLRKRMVGNPFGVTDQTREAALDYIKKNRSVREVVLSGGDPLLLETDTLNHLLEQLRRIPHIQVLRIHTRVPGVLPSRITDQLVSMLNRHHPLYVNIQFNHPNEITPQSTQACAKLADAGIPLGSQTVLLKGVNDDPEVMIRLMQKLLTLRIKPYYLHHPDPVRGTGHFRTEIACGLSIMEHLRGRVSGMGIPQYMIDLPGGGGKIPLLPESVLGEENGMLKVTGLHGKVYGYPGKA
ncbi:MAG: KamA family radical SAM protein [Proteobacteria bacterium]|nr:KamA family radical SAM protein [Pseudomonadota bacterium]MBU4471799.1 KamA family radical SAM protein [Pseudomonadota bacterium]MCG2750580.1 KamA family radical SAM protein [Desulfobacteraceae bacterium]